jgi:hypothetical protein
MQTRAKRTPRVMAKTALEAKRIERRDHQACQPQSLVRGGPYPGCRMAGAARHGLGQTLQTALRKATLFGNAPHALWGMLTQTLAHPWAFVP